LVEHDPLLYEDRSREKPRTVAVPPLAHCAQTSLEAFSRGGHGGGGRSCASPGGRSAARLELQTAKEILAEVFHARPGEVEEMSWGEEEVGGGRGVLGGE